MPGETMIYKRMKCNVQNVQRLIESRNRNRNRNMIYATCIGIVSVSIGILIFCFK